MEIVTYRNMPGPVGDCLKPAALATTASVHITPTTSLLVTTGHIGLDLKTGALVNDTIENEFDAIFSCLDAALKDAGATRGLRQAYKFVSYLVNAEHEPVMQAIFKKRWPGHTPTWATVIVKSINVPGMSAEIVAEGATQMAEGA